MPVGVLALAAAVVGAQNHASLRGYELGTINVTASVEFVMDPQKSKLPERTDNPGIRKSLCAEHGRYGTRDLSLVEIETHYHLPRGR